MTRPNPIVTGTAACVSLLASAFLYAQEVADVPVSSAASGIQEKISQTVSGVVSGEISAAEKGMALDSFLQQTFMRITDCWTLCRQELLLAKESARQEAIRTAKDIFKKRDKNDADPESTRQSILDRLPPLNLDDTVRQAAEDAAKDAVLNTLSGPGNTSPDAGTDGQDR